ncbi:MAG: hypothetical protein WA949_03045 [Phormidesmis sp.]
MIETHTILIVFGSNCLLAGIVLAMTVRLWRWRCDLAQMTDWLRTSPRSVPATAQQLGLTLMVRRSQLVETRLGLAQLMLMSRQATQLSRQLLSLIRLLRWAERRRRWHQSATSSDSSASKQD